ncbi:MAG: type II CAAX endopeptidase family protein [Dokdonella sp.]|uniref:CPBP family intramembrane glutamic endopeptidase n=1 Tax=Dokdonella sp. TaxID=2291710 RepID=UPI002CCE74C8|nr:type II CAAX endopeptidase family protein [Dokdonella sp.]HOX72572.1 type II CAAX endopeptidase family protein [Dokdonella sp.]HPG94393.1 type II CAAX endopeptidase family protein [Dokdonella sp.]HPN78534.1 type II CAAX endopeptidase family protein [Dokdonella sp.]
MKALFFDADRRLRNGWWILLFVVVFLLSRWIYTPLSRVLREAGVGGEWIEPLRFVFVLLVTGICLRLRREPLASVGFQLGSRWFAQSAAGTLIGAAMMLAIVGMIAASGGVRLELDPSRSLATLAYGFYLFLCVALFEETLFRGFLFQRMVDGTGVWIAQLAVALLFALGHWGNPGMEGTTEVVATLDLALGAIMLGLAYLRTRSLALPVGLHLGWNWTQGHVLGFGVSGFDYAGWFKPEFQGLPQWATGGEFGPESSVFAVLVDVVVIVLLWRWKGSAKANRLATHPLNPQLQGGS